MIIRERRLPFILLQSAVLVLATVLFFVHFRHPIFLTSSSGINDAVGFVLAVAFPFLAWLSLLRVGRGWGTAVFVVGIVPMLAYSAFMLLMALLVHSGTELVKEQLWNG